MASSEGDLHAFLALGDHGIDGIVHRTSTLRYAPVRVKSRTRGTGSRLGLSRPPGHNRPILLPQSRIPHVHWHTQTVEPGAGMSESILRQPPRDRSGVSRHRLRMSPFHLPRDYCDTLAATEIHPPSSARG